MSDNEDLDSNDVEQTTCPMTSSDLRKGGYVVIKCRPCKIVEMSMSKTGKHGHTKVHFVGIDIFTGKKLEDICPSTHTMDVPVVHRQEYQLDGIDDDDDDDDDGCLLLTDMNGNTKNDVPVPQGVLGLAIRDSLDSGDSSIVTVINALGEEACISIKDAE
ncbi:translation protein SH3-like domain-containing protein [Aspergillus caelatus]|uniref:Eukaryotic translation initiation factor 5A n=1 Tax=Aspergillus caelatus TaxID=61420 RepID=A0A5N7AME7_9EURO|nr:translation protein SH3-like domain-containing protein [Aspergillus caelatus]KAE8370416.1 translation protein SH3-like domain-containing protein [Aspergillus caelatus]